MSVAERRAGWPSLPARRATRVLSPNFANASGMRTYTATPKDIQQRWFVVDADGVVLGRLATEVAKIIRGKRKPSYTPHMDTGDNVIIINAAKVKVTGR